MERGPVCLAGEAKTEGSQVAAAGVLTLSGVCHGSITEHNSYQLDTTGHNKTQQHIMGPEGLRMYDSEGGGLYRVVADSQMRIRILKIARP